MASDAFQSAWDELWEELRQEPVFMFEDGNKARIDETTFKSITLTSVLSHIYNSPTSGEIEISFRPSDKRQVAFKLTTSDKHFALMKTGDMPDWLKAELFRFNVNHRFEEEGFFERINQEDSPINILMGSRSFYEGWDSNRPNVINYINIGLGEDTRKFILQSTGRGVRIEPVKDKRKRLLPLYNAREVDESLFDRIKDKVLPIETLFIFGTNRNALETIIKQLQHEKTKGEGVQLQLFVNYEVNQHKLLVPTYKQAERPIYEAKERRKFEISQQDFDLLNKFAQWIPDDRVLLMKYNTEPVKVKLLRDSSSSQSNFKLGDRQFKNIDLVVQKIFDYFSLFPPEFKNLKELDEEIRHFKNVRVTLEDISQIQKKVDTVRDYPNRKRQLEAELSKLSNETRQRVEAMLTKEATQTYEYEHKRIEIKYVANHYYVPLILSENEKIDYIKHIIKEPSEVKFVNDLEEYLTKSDNIFKNFDWWLFSKLDESLDEVYIPYYDSNSNRMSKFYPDFIFWLAKGNDYYIVFVDPKGTEHAAWADKISGYKELFEEKGTTKTISSNGIRVKIKLFLRADDAAVVKGRFPEHSPYWFDAIEEMLEPVS